MVGCTTNSNQEQQAKLSSSARGVLAAAAAVLLRLYYYRVVLVFYASTLFVLFDIPLVERMIRCPRYLASVFVFVAANYGGRHRAH